MIERDRESKITAPVQTQNHQQNDGLFHPQQIAKALKEIIHTGNPFSHLQNNEGPNSPIIDCHKLISAQANDDSFSNLTEAEKNFFIRQAPEILKNAEAYIKQDRSLSRDTKQTLIELLRQYTTFYLYQEYNFLLKSGNSQFSTDEFDPKSLHFWVSSCLSKEKKQSDDQ